MTHAPGAFEIFALKRKEKNHCLWTCTYCMQSNNNPQIQEKGYQIKEKRFPFFRILIIYILYGVGGSNDNVYPRQTLHTESVTIGAF